MLFRSVAIWLDREQPTLFKASISCDNPVREIDSRPSDAINLALRIGAPVLMSRATIESCGVGPDQDPEPQKGTVYELRAADGGSVGRAEAFTEPKAGDCVYVQQVLSITEVREDAELVVNEIADRTRRIIGPGPTSPAAPRPGP